jgi:hypothetical protein
MKETRKSISLARLLQLGMLGAFLTLVCSLVFVTPVPAHAATKQVGVKKYDLATVLRKPHRTVKHTIKHSKHVKAPGKGQGSPTVTFTLTVEADIIYVFYGDQFICGYGIGAASADPAYAEVNEMGFLYINGNEIDTTDTTGIAATAGETGCYAGASGSFWEMDVDGAAVWLGGPTLGLNAYVSAFQP